MAAHRISDTYIDMRAAGQSPRGADVITAINWPDYINFVVTKTIPIWWIPIHTLTFLLPDEYRVLAAAYLSFLELFSSTHVEENLSSTTQCSQQLLPQRVASRIQLAIDFV